MQHRRVYSNLWSRHLTIAYQNKTTRTDTPSKCTDKEISKNINQAKHLENDDEKMI